MKSEGRETNLYLISITNIGTLPLNSRHEIVIGREKEKK